MRTLYDRGWEVGLHGSYDSYTDRSTLASEKDRLETVLGAEVIGGRQHYLNLERPETWRHHRRIGLRYDSSLGSTDRVGFHHGYGARRPFDDDFVVFPLTAMEVALLRDRSPDEAWARCEELLDEAAANDAIMTVLWHQRFFNESEFPGYKRLYRRLVEGALARGAWVGPLGEMYERLSPSLPEMTE
jgi:peptidoglycan/xylan/chitin deacetylase (PgdA/CDA1 family)